MTREDGMAGKGRGNPAAGSMPGSPQVSEKPRNVPLLLAVLVLVIAAAATAFLVAIETSRENSRRIQCGNNLKNLGALLVERRAGTSGGKEGDRLPLLAGTAIGRTLMAACGTCPADPGRDSGRPRTESAGIGWEGTSYTVYRSRASKTETSPRLAEPLAFCVHHEGGFNVLLDDGRVVFVQDRDEKGSGEDPEQARLRRLVKLELERKATVGRK